MNTLFIQILLLLLINSTCSQVQQQWVAVYNGPPGIEDDVASAITVDDSGNVYVTGSSAGIGNYRSYATIKYNSNSVQQWVKRWNDSLFYNVAEDIILDRLGNVFVTGSGPTIKYDSNGNVIWSNNLGGHFIRIDDSGNVFIGGIYQGHSYMVLKINPNGNLIWFRTYNGQYGDDRPEDMALDKSGNVIITGSGRNANPPYDWDYVTIKYSSNGDTLWIRRYDWQSLNQKYNLAFGVAVDDSNNVYVTGWSDGISTSADIATIKYNSNGDSLWTKRYDGVNHGSDIGYDITVDSLGYVYIAGKTDAGSYITLKYDRNGNLIWSARLLSSALLGPNPRICLDHDRNVYISAATYRPGNYSNYAVVKYNNNGVQQWLAEYYRGFVNYAYALTVDKFNNVYVTGGSTGSGTGYDYMTIKYSQNPAGIISNSYTPHEFKLYQNYPNPFNPKSKIKFEIANTPLNPPEGGKQAVRLAIYDVLGREVVTLVNEPLKPGTYEVEWNGINYPSGMYFYKLMAGEYTQTKRMILIK